MLIQWRCVLISLNQNLIFLDEFVIVEVFDFPSSVVIPSNATLASEFAFVTQ